MVGLGLAVPGVACAWCGEPAILGYPELWPWAVAAVVAVLQAPVVFFLCHLSWARSLLAALLFTGSSLLLVLTVGQRWVLGRPQELMLAGPAILLGWSVLLWFARRGRAQFDVSPGQWARRVFLATLLMGAVAAAVIPVFEWQFPNPAGVPCDNNACLSHVKKISLCLLQYRDDHGRVPPVADMEGLKAALMPYAASRETFSCPRDLEGRFFPVGGTRSYACPDFRSPAWLKGPPPETPVVWDSQPRHNAGRNVGFLDGHVHWKSESDFQALLAHPAPRGSP